MNYETVPRDHNLHRQEVVDLKNFAQIKVSFVFKRKAHNATSVKLNLITLEHGFQISQSEVGFKVM